MDPADRPVVYVEDNPDHAELFLRCWRNHGNPTPVVHLEDGASALAYLDRAERSEVRRPRLVVLDLRMPKVDGLEVLTRYKTSERIGDVPVVILSTSANENDVARCYAAQANSYVVKPQDHHQLDALVHDLGAWWCTWNVPALRP